MIARLFSVLLVLATLLPAIAAVTASSASLRNFYAQVDDDTYEQTFAQLGQLLQNNNEKMISLIQNMMKVLEPQLGSQQPQQQPPMSYQQQQGRGQPPANPRRESYPYNLNNNNNPNGRGLFLNEDDYEEDELSGEVTWVVDYDRPRYSGRDVVSRYEQRDVVDRFEVPRTERVYYNDDNNNNDEGEYSNAVEPGYYELYEERVRYPPRGFKGFKGAKEGPKGFGPRYGKDWKR